MNISPEIYNYFFLYHIEFDIIVALKNMKVNPMKHKDNIPLNFKEKNNSKISLITSVIVLIILFAFFRELDYNLVQKPKKEAAIQAEKERLAAEEAANAPIITSVDILAVGDNTVYNDYIYDSGQSDSENWNYDHLYSNMANEIKAADLSIVAQTTVLSSNHDTVNNYSITPSEVGDALVNAGFDVIAAATNSIDDYGPDSIMETIQYWKTSHPGIPILGLHETQAEANTVTTMTINDISIALLNYTYGTNNSGAGEGKEFMIDVFDKAKIKAAVNQVKDYDCIIFIAHWGDENTTEVNEFQKQWAAYLMELGVDVLIGAHPHVLQPYGRLSDTRDNEMIVFYSLGNFVSTAETIDGLLGGVAKLTIEKTIQNGVSTVKFLTPVIEPMVMHYSYDDNTYETYMLKDYSDDLAYGHYMIHSTNDFTVENLQNRFKDIMSMNVTPSTARDLVTDVETPDTGEGKTESGENESSEE